MALKIRKSVGKSGLANVRLLKKSIIVQFVDDGDAYELPTNTWEEGRPAGQYIVTLAKDNTKILRINPLPGTYIVQVSKLANRGQIDIPQTRIQRGGTYQRRDGKGTFTIDDHLVWDVLLEVLSEGPYSGLLINYSLNYCFQPATTGPYADLVDTKATLEKMEKFFRAAAGTNVATLEIPFSDNVLPWMEKYLLAHRKPFSVTTGEKGYVETLSELPDGVMLSAPKKTAKKSARKS